VKEKYFKTKYRTVGILTLMLWSISSAKYNSNPEIKIALQ
jgi:hypothetical protein